MIENHEKKQLSFLGVVIENNKQKFWHSPTWILELEETKFQKTF